MTKSYTLANQRRTDAQYLADQIVALTMKKAETKFGCKSVEDQNAFTLGYMNSLLATVAAASPAAMKELASALKYSQEAK